MRTIIHVSDLHAGRLDPDSVPPLVQTIRGAEPNLVVVSGDLTQRATVAQFRRARALLDSLELPILTVPGNHDVPLWNPVERLLAPFARYKRYISANLEPVYEDREIIVAGVNTARRSSWAEGRINLDQVNALLARFAAGEPGAIRIVVTHHPFDLPPGIRRQRKLVGRARMAMARLAKAGAHLFLSGHLHLSHISHSAERYRIEGHSALIVQAGTVSIRGRGEEPSFNALRLEADRLAMDRFVWSPVTRTFGRVAAGTFRRADVGWLAAPLEG